MRLIGLVAMLALAGGCTPVRMAGFEAAAVDGERIDLTGVPMWMDGRFRLSDGTTGTVRRRARGERRAIGYGERRDGSAIVVDALDRKYGRVTFTLDGPSAPGGLAGQCGYGRTSRETSIGPVTVGSPVDALEFRCTFERAGREVGALSLVGGDELSWQEKRRGGITLDGATLGIRSVHDGERLFGPTDTALGYAFEVDDRRVGMADLNGPTKRLALPRDPAHRQAALAASIALALFWDPGDVN